MTRAAPYLDQVTFDVRYAFGHRYLDRCGQTLIDIERMMPDWVPGQIDQNSGAMRNVEADSALTFGPANLTISARRPGDLKRFSGDAAKIWGIVRDNLGLSEFIRVGFRPQYLLPAMSTEDAERLIGKADLNVRIPDEWGKAGYSPTIRNVVVVVERENIEFRIQLQGIIRTESIDPSFLATRPRMLSHGQQKAQIALDKQIAQYRQKPRFAVQLDVDCGEFEPKKVDAIRTITEQHAIVERDFLPILKRL